MTLSWCSLRKDLDWRGVCRKKTVLHGCVRLKLESESQSVHFKNLNLFLFRPTSLRQWGVEKPFLCQSPECWAKETNQFKNALNMSNLQQSEMETQERKGVGGAGGVIEKALDEACTSCLCLSSLYFFFNISYVCIFLPTEERVKKTRRESEVSAWMSREQRGKCFPPISFLLLFKGSLLSSNE